MKHQTLIAKVTTLAAILSLAGQAGVFGQEGSKDFVKSLEVSVDVLRDGKVEVEQNFLLSLSGSGIKRGPILSYVTVYQGLGGLILDQKMEVTEVLRNGKPEPFSILRQGGVVQITCGSSDVFLEATEQRYEVRYTRIGDWSFREGMANWAYEITEPFKNYRIEKVKFDLELPEGVELAQFATGLSGSEADGPGYQLNESPNGAVIESTAALRPQAFMFMNASWKASSFATQSQWIEVLTQHPKLPLSGFSAIILLSVLILLVRRLIKSHRMKPVPAS